MPIVLPLLLQGVSVDAWSIARPLITLMLIPLAIGLFIKARYDEIADFLSACIGIAACHQPELVGIPHFSCLGVCEQRGQSGAE
jgi:hypothetical protein